jgi:hypothetical protein
VLEALAGSHVDRFGSVALPEVGIGPSLVVIGGVLAVSAAASLLVRERR